MFVMEHIKVIYIGLLILLGFGAIYKILIYFHPNQTCALQFSSKPMFV